MPDSIEKINKHLQEVLGPENGYFGRVSTWGQEPNEYAQLGFVPTEDFEPMLASLSEEQLKNLVRVMTYFEIHIRPLKNMLNAVESQQLYKYYSETAWSHFATVVMFGMLEFTVKGKRGVRLNDKGKKIKKFLEDNLPQDIKVDIVDRYSVEDIFKHKKPQTFGEVIDHLWDDVRCGFVHDIGIEAKGLEYNSLVGVGTKEEPLTIRRDVPMPEWLRLTWQAILNFYGYKGKLESPRLNKRK